MFLGLSNSDSQPPSHPSREGETVMPAILRKILHRLLGIRLEHWHFRLSTEDTGCGGVGVVSKKTKGIVGLRVTLIRSSVMVGFFFLSTLLEED
jgi:hypothetical protein